MIGILLAILLGIVLTAIVRKADRHQQPALILLVLGGYVLRLTVQTFIRDIQFFSHELGGDAWEYELQGQEIARLWRIVGVSFFTEEEMPGIGATVLPQNLFAGIIYLNGGDLTRTGCVALIAFAAGLTCFNLYDLAVSFGAHPKTALWTVVFFYFGPTFLHYTSDAFKDGLVVCFAINALGASLRLMHRVTVLQIAVGVLSLCGLWYVRFYLIFVTTAPLAVGLLGMRSKSAMRPLLGAMLFIFVGILLIQFTDLAQRVTERAASGYEVGTAEVVRTANASGGSGVAFDDGGRPFGAIVPKLLYTVFSPFPWASGSLGFHVGKVDSLIIYFFIYRAMTVIKMKERRLIFIMAMTFIIPCTVMYATSMANVGLIVRQRLPVVAALTFLAAMYKPVKERAESVEKAESAADSEMGDLAGSRAS
jgi:hypothetical protein